MHVHHDRNFPQAKLDSKINVSFLVNEHGALFLSHNNSVHIILFKSKKKKLKNPIGQKKRYG